MLDNEKWLTAVCLTTLEKIARPESERSSAPPNPVALQQLIDGCTAHLPNNIQFKDRRQYASDTTPPQGPPRAAQTQKSTNRTPSAKGDPIIFLVQQKLNSLDLYKKTPDGIDGSETEKALIEFKKSKNIFPPDGKANDATLKALFN